MRPSLCPICKNPARLFRRGTVSPGEYFEREESFHIAAGRDQSTLDVYRCSSCGHGCTLLDCDASIIDRWYESAPADETWLSQARARRRTANKVLRRIDSLVDTKGELLDLGASAGIFLEFALDQGWNVRAVEPARWAIGHLHASLGGEYVVQGDHRALSILPAGSVDVLTAFDVLEHVVAPNEFLSAIDHVVRPGGLLVLSTPRFDSLLARIMGRNWYCIFPAHLHYFTLPSLARSLRQAGFSIVQVRSHTRYLDVAYLFERLLVQCGLAGRNVRNLPLLRSLVLPANLGDTFEVYARKD